MGILSKISYWKIHFLATRVEIRSALNVLGFISDVNAETKNRDDVFAVIPLVANLNWKDHERLMKKAYVYLDKKI